MQYNSDEILYRILEFNYFKEKFTLLDLSTNNKELHLMNSKNPVSLEVYIENQMIMDNTRLAIGKYGEDRIIYDDRKMFSQEDKRSIHLGLDFGTAPGTRVYSPLDAKVHSFNNNSNDGDYGPTIILEHELEGLNFYTLYGHLSLSSLDNLSTSKVFKAGEHIGAIGDNTENGNWPPHLHFQIINNMLDYSGDFPGVCSTKEKFNYMELCPNPNLLLKIPGLD